MGMAGKVIAGRAAPAAALIVTVQLGTQPVADLTRQLTRRRPASTPE